MRRRKRRIKTSRKKVLPKNIEQQVDAYIDALQKYNKKLPHPRDQKNYPFLSYFFKHFIEDQNSRALEIDSREYDNVLKIANNQLPVKTLWILCIDGRVLSVLEHGATAGVGNSLQVPGGILREFVRGKDGLLKLKNDSHFANLITKVLAQSKIDVIAEVFDSHIGCAARMAEEQVKGRNRPDMGLYADISHKAQMAGATKAFVKRVFGDSKKVLTILTSFDPHTGYLYMGLGSPYARSVVEKNGKAYTKELIDKLVKEGKVISTEALVEDQSLRKVFEAHDFPLDWRAQYVKSAKYFWEAIASMKKTLLPILQKKILAIYPDLARSDQLAKLELEERAMLLLTNAFSGYLHNKDHKHHSRTREKEEHGAHYPYGVHKEEGIKVSEGGFPPYNVSMFAVQSSVEKNLPANIEISASLLRKNRSEGRVVDPTKNFTEPLEFAQASLPLVVQEIVRDAILEDEWEKLGKTDWSDMPEEWNSMSDNEFFDYLHTKENIPFGVARGINNLRRRMAVLYDPFNPISSRLIEQYKVALPVVADKFRRIRFLVPFVKLGFS